MKTVLWIFKTILVWPLAFLIMLSSLVFPPKAQGDGIVAIYTGSGGSGVIEEFKIDLARKNSWRYYHSPWKERNKDALFEGFRFIGRLNAKKIAAFRAAANTYGFDKWEGRYAPDEPPGAGFGVWWITIIFADGTKQSSGGYHSWDYAPEGWPEMAAAFRELIGIDILANV